jgi:hypothetical protein
METAIHPTPEEPSLNRLSNRCAVCSHEIKFQDAAVLLSRALFAVYVNKGAHRKVTRSPVNLFSGERRCKCLTL